MALGLKFDADISKGSYQQIRDASKKDNADIFSTYHEVKTSKKNVILKGSWIEESEVEVNLED